MSARIRLIFGCALALAMLPGCDSSEPAAPMGSSSCSAGGAGCVGTASSAAGTNAGGRTASGSATAGASASATAGSGASGSAAGASVDWGQASAGAGGAPQPMAAGATSESQAGSPAAAESDAGMPTDAGACGICGAYAVPTLLANIGPTALDALSGLASSARHAGVIYAHNDHDRATIYALNAKGELLTRLEISGERPNDVEDIAVGRCPEGSCIYLADIGDNAAMRASYTLLRLPEPQQLPAAPSSQSTLLEAERFRFVYEDGSHNAEGMFPAPDGSAIYIVTKPSAGAASVYRIAAPFSADMNRATKVAQLGVPAAGDMQTSAAAVHPCGLGFLVRTYDRVYEFRATPGMPFESAFQAEPSVAAMPEEPQSEGIDYLADGHGFISSGEGRGAPILVTRCK